MDIPRGATPGQLALLMWTPTILRHIWAHTHPHLTSKDCPRLDQADLSRYFGMLLIFCCYPARTLHAYFNMGQGRMLRPGSEDFLSRNAFTALNAALHFDKTTIHSLLCTSFQHHLLPSTSTCVDEVRIGCKNVHCPCVKFNPRKADRWALESLSLHDRSGYMYHFYPTSSSITPFNAILEFGSKLARLCPGFEITADSRFSSLNQATKLLEKGVYCTLACKANHPKDLFKSTLAKDLKKPHAAAATNGSVIATTMWSQKKVNIISSWWSVSEQLVHTGYHDRRIPLHHYNNTKTYADTFQQLYAAYHFKHKHQRWECNHLIGWFEFAITNAYILHRLLHGDVLSHLDFLVQVGKSLLAHPIE